MNLDDDRARHRVDRARGSGARLRAILGFLRRRAHDDGIRDERGGAVAIVQRFGGASNLKVHLHALVLEGLFTHDGNALQFHANPFLDADDVADALATVEAHVTRRSPFPDIEIPVISLHEPDHPAPPGRPRTAPRRNNRLTVDVAAAPSGPSRVTFDRLAVGI